MFTCALFGIAFVLSALNPSNAYALSDNSYLEHLAVEGYEISPGFRKTTLTYEVKVVESTDNLVIDAQPEDLRAKVEISGAEALQPGKNTVTITVKAQNGTLTEYRLFAWREGNLAGSSARLDTIVIEDHEFTPAFRDDVFDYHVYVASDVTALAITAKPVDPNAQVTVRGADNLSEPINEIVIRVVPADTLVSEEYRIIAEKLEPYDKKAYQQFLLQEWMRANARWIWIAIGVVVVAIVVPAGIILAKRQGRKK